MKSFKSIQSHDLHCEYLFQDFHILREVQKKVSIVSIPFKMDLFYTL